MSTKRKTLISAEGKAPAAPLSPDLLALIQLLVRAGMKAKLTPASPERQEPRP